MIVLERWWKLESILRLGIFVLLSLVAGILVLVAAGSSLARAAGADPSFIAMAVSFIFVQGLAVVWVTRFLREHSVTWTHAFGFRHRTVRAIGLACALTLVAVPLTLFVASLVLSLVQRWFGIQLPAQATVEFIRNGAPPWQIAVMGFSAVVLAPVAEEALFRGVLYTAIKQRGYPRLALWLTAILFGLIHMNLATAIPLILLALLFTWLYEATRNLLASIVAHALFNGVAFVALLVDVPGWLEKVMRP